MKKTISQSSAFVLLVLRCHAAEYQFVANSPRLAEPERVKHESVAVVAATDPARYGFQKSKGKTGQAADGAS